jgi:hypothetical protein
MFGGDSPDPGSPMTAYAQRKQGEADAAQHGGDDGVVR